MSGLFSRLKRDARFGMGLLSGAPFSCLMQITNRCNMTCSFCDFWPHPAPKQDELTVEEFARLSDELSSIGCFLISIEGGEPMVRKDLPAIIAALSRHHLTALFTNGWFVTKESAQTLWAAGLTAASVSIDYASADKHDAKRGLPGATERAWRAVETLRDTAPRGPAQVQVMTVLMRSNQDELPALFAQSAARGVGQQVTLLSTSGFRRGRSEDELPDEAFAPELLALFDRTPHLKFFRQYFEQLAPFLANQRDALPVCRAGKQGFNIDHLGNVAACIERIGTPIGNVRNAHIKTLWQDLASQEAVIEQCQDCLTACRGIQQAMGGGGTLRSWGDLLRRVRVG